MDAATLRAHLLEPLPNPGEAAAPLILFSIVFYCVGWDPPPHHHPDPSNHLFYLARSIYHVVFPFILKTVFQAAPCPSISLLPSCLQAIGVAAGDLLMEAFWDTWSSHKTSNTSSRHSLSTNSRSGSAHGRRPCNASVPRLAWEQRQQRRRQYRTPLRGATLLHTVRQTPSLSQGRS